MHILGGSTRNMFFAKRATTLGFLVTLAVATGAITTAVQAQDGQTQNDGTTAEAAPQQVAQANTGGGIPQLITTAQKQAQSLDRVPIAVAAFDASALEQAQIENFGDLQFNIPNVTFAKGNFTSSNFQIRGVGNTLVAASADQGVGIHVNDVPLNAPRLFETEYFDLERVEILRGPQGTLQGRNSTSGTVNMITKRPTDEFEGYGEFEYGNFDSKRAEAAVNIPFGNDLGAVRLAANWVDRNGYTRNLYDPAIDALDPEGKGRPIDGRDSYALRGSIRLNPSDDTEINLMVSWFKESSDRSRSQKQMCKTDPTGLLGCLPTELAFEGVNGLATLAGVLVTPLVAGPLALGPFEAPIGPVPDNPADFRQVANEFDPRYKSDELLITLHIDQDLGDNYTLSLVAGYQDTSLLSESDYNNDLGPVLSVPDLYAIALPNNFALLYPDGRLALSDIDPGNTGILGLNILDRPDRLTSYDRSASTAEQFTVELRLTSDYDGPVNFLIGGFYLDYTSEFDYYVVSNALDYFATVAAGVDGIGVPTPFFNNETDEFSLESFAFFGEVYWDITDELRFTGGLRFTRDKKFVRDRSLLLNGVPLVIGSPEATLPPFREESVGFSELTGRAVLEWTPDLDATDSTLVYASYSRGYKGGGINPAFDPLLFPDTSEIFEPEFINAFEIGTKNRFANNTWSVNATGFYYDYKNLQVSRIQNRTSFNENIDAEIYGAELELAWAPNQNWLFNVNASWLGTSIKDEALIDPRDPTQGDPNTTLVKDLGSAANCVVHHNGAPDPTTVPGFSDVFPVIIADPGAAAGGSGAFTDCASLKTNLDAVQKVISGDPDAVSPYTVDDGNAVSLKGNELQQAPDFSINIGAQYTHFFDNGMNLTFRVDYYYQTAMWGRIFNRDPIDRISSYDLWNLQLTLEGPDEGWYIRAFVQNLENDDAPIGLYVTDASSGLWTNVFTTEPRRYGIIVGARF